jgi:ketosteroid isomerase-like protein
VFADFGAVQNGVLEDSMRGGGLSFCFVAVLTFVTVFAQPSGPDAGDATTKSAIEHVLLTQQDAWNHHDLDAFMTGYWNSPDLTFFSGAKESKGWQATIDRYRATYASPGHEMGKLAFSDLRVENLGPNAAFVRGVWQLTMSDGKTPHGRFTLIFRKFPDGWKIIHDHTSAAD